MNKWLLVLLVGLVLVQGLEIQQPARRRYQLTCTSITFSVTMLPLDNSTTSSDKWDPFITPIIEMNGEKPLDICDVADIYQDLIELDTAFRQVFKLNRAMVTMQRQFRDLHDVASWVGIESN